MQARISLRNGLVSARSVLRPGSTRFCSGAPIGASRAHAEICQSPFQANDRAMEPPASCPAQRASVGGTVNNVDRHRRIRRHRGVQGSVVGDPEIAPEQDYRGRSHRPPHRNGEATVFLAAASGSRGSGLSPLDSPFLRVRPGSWLGFPLPRFADSRDVGGFGIRRPVCTATDQTLQVEPACTSYTEEPPLKFASSRTSAIVCGSVTFGWYSRPA